MALQTFLVFNLTDGVYENTTPVVVGGVGNGGKIVALNEVTGRLDLSMMPSGITPEVAVIAASEALTAGDYVNIWDDAGTAKVRKADASGGITKKAHGYVSAGVAQDANATVYFETVNDQLGSLTPGKKQYLDGGVNAGKTTETCPTTTGWIAQCLGTAFSATEMFVEIDQPVKL